MKEREWIDISQPLTNDIAGWPGDTPFEFKLAYTKEQTGSVNIGQIQTSLHCGTHIDAPFHFDNDGKKVHELDINLYVGLSLIIDVTGCESVGKRELEEFPLEGVTRLLLKTRTAEETDPTQFPLKFTYLRKDIGPFLKEKGIRLLGVDVPSVDPVDSKTMDAHHSLHDNGVSILENIMLGHVGPGNYDLIALPLAIQNADGSPVRAVVRPVE
ncbi:arylformamidase [Sporosarcina sp. HYO08]|uniref:arylformamidase n=1 Tax=Sporosarcina sp. HYO08 TaxID=1759557 RepID=UPI000796F749|nr:arylformamidase [Sporosarcina sp. HYO08]KXH84058.1 kynurenine formamidase [Sporosarcina sp. HYO08]